VCKRISGPLVSCVTSAIVEVSYTAVKQAKALQKKIPSLFDESFKAFFIRCTDPIYLQFAKLDMLELVANEKNWKMIVNELGFNCYFIIFIIY
jgi:vesicle coat complex subunit